MDLKGLEKNAANNIDLYGGRPHGMRLKQTTYNKNIRNEDLFLFTIASIHRVFVVLIE